MNCISKLSEQQKIAFMKAFTRLAKTDGDFSDDEKKFILDTAKIYGINKSEDVLTDATDDEIINDVKTIDDRRAALELVKEMCILAHADDVLSDQETMFIGKVGQAMGVELEKVEQISNWVIDRIIWLEEAKLIFEEAQ